MSQAMNTPLTHPHVPPSSTQHKLPRKLTPPTSHLRIPTLQTPNRSVRTPHPRHNTIRTHIYLHSTTYLLHRTETYIPCTSSPSKLSRDTTPTLLRNSTTPPPLDASPPSTNFTQQATVLRRLYGTLLSHLTQFHTDLLNAHDSRQRQLADYQTHLTTPLTSRYTETQHTDTHHTLQHTLHKTTSLADSINTLHHLPPIHKKYESWIQQLPALHLPGNGSTSMTHRRYHLLQKSVKRAIRTHKQLHQSLCTTLGRQRNKVIDHTLNINFLSDACHMVHPTQLSTTTTLHHHNHLQDSGLPHSPHTQQLYLHN